MSDKSPSADASATIARARKADPIVERAGPTEAPAAPDAPKHPGAPTAEIEYGAGCTINMGNFESMRVDVRLRLPCKASIESIDKTFAFAKEWVDARAQEEVTAIETSRDAKR